MKRNGDQNGYSKSCACLCYIGRSNGKYNQNPIPNYLCGGLKDTTPANIGDCWCRCKEMLSARIFWEQ